MLSFIKLKLAALFTKAFNLTYFLLILSRTGALKHISRAKPSY
jgi:hypothetical protein